MLYTRKGDDGTTKTFNCDQRISKSSYIAEALGSLDETNSFLGLIKIKSQNTSFVLPENTFLLKDAIDRIQQDLFIIQAELAGAEKTISKEKIIWLENIINDIEKTLPPIKTFFVSGGTELSSLFDVARTIARRAERRVIKVVDEHFKNEKNQKELLSKETLAYLNRLSSILYAFARISNSHSGITEEIPKYD